MTEPIHTRGDPLESATQEEILSALFANMVIQQTNMAMMLLGKVAHPESGEFVQDLDAARMFIDQLEMLAVKTRGNLTKQEEHLMKQALASLHMAFVEAAGAAEAPPTVKPAPPPQQGGSEPAPAATQPAAEAAPGPSAATAPPPEESRKKFSKKY